MKLPLSEIRTAEPFRSLFPMSTALVDSIAKDMRSRGFAEEHPLALWRGHRSTILDGHTRAAAAEAAGIVDVPVVMVECSTEDEALEYAIRCQRNRRSLTDAELLRCVRELDKRRDKRESLKRGDTKPDPQPCGTEGATAAATADTLGISQRKVEQVRTIEDHATPEVKAAVESGNMSINRAYEDTQKRRRPERPVPDYPPADRIEAWHRQLRETATGKPKAWWPVIAECMRNVADSIEREAREPDTASTEGAGP